jgi:pimeloyl-ACP methyl ester carboxylesterase
MLGQDWGIAFEHLTCPVHFWHGAEDELVTDDMVASFARDLPNSRVHSLRAESHWFIFRYLEQILPAFRTGRTAFSRAYPTRGIPRRKTPA